MMIINICLQQPVADTQVDIFNETVKWEELAPLPVCRNAHTAVLLGGSVYVGGGYEGRSSNDNQYSYRLDVYNLTTNQWSSSPITTPYSCFAMTVLDDKLITAGGETKNGEVVKKVLVLNAGQWKDYSEMPTAKLCATAVGYCSMLIVVGGRIIIKGKQKTTVTTTELLDTTNGCWYTCNNLPSPHQQMKAVIMNNKVYLLGGFDEDRNESPQVFVASLDTLSTHQLNWQSAPSTPWCCSAAVVLYNKFLLTVGGWKQSRTSEVCIFNPSIGQWKHLTNIPAARNGPAGVGVANNILVIGGTTNKAENSNTIWIGLLK